MGSCRRGRRQADGWLTICWMSLTAAGVPTFPGSADSWEPCAGGRGRSGGGVPDRTEGSSGDVWAVQSAAGACAAAASTACLLVEHDAEREGGGGGGGIFVGSIAAFSCLEVGQLVRQAACGVGGSGTHPASKGARERPEG